MNTHGYMHCETLRLALHIPSGIGVVMAEPGRIFIGIADLFARTVVVGAVDALGLVCQIVTAWICSIAISRHHLGHAVRICG